MVLLVVLLPFLAFALVRLAGRLLPTVRSRRVWRGAVAAWVVLSTAAFCSIADHYLKQDPGEALSAWHKDGGFMALAFVFYNSVLVALVASLVAVVALVRRRLRS